MNPTETSHHQVLQRYGHGLIRVDKEPQQQSISDDINVFLKVSLHTAAAG